MTGISQFSSSYSLYLNDVVFNFPFETTFSTSSPFGWPQIIVTVMGPDIFGRVVPRGYGSVHFPTEPGYHERVI
jgi:B9 domain-containing protein 1